MKPTLKTACAALFASLLMSGASLAQSSTTEQSLHATAIADVEAALSALQAGDFTDAAQRLDVAARAASRLHLQKVSAELALATPGFNVGETRFAIADSARLTLEEFIEAQNVIEASATDDAGRVVTVRVIGDEAAMASFMTLAGDEKAQKKAKVELAEMRGQPALKRRGKDGSLTVATMSDDDHVVIEVVGEDADAVMSFINELEATPSDE